MLKITIESDDGVEVVDFTADEQKAFEYIAYSPSAWIAHCIKNRVRKAVDKIVEETTNLNFKKTPVADKLVAVKDADIKSAKVREDEFQAELENK